MLLNNKVALVTGSNRGIGAAILEQFAKNGADVFAHSRLKTVEFESKCKSLEEECGVTVIPLYFDIRDSISIKEAVNQILKSKKDVDILVNNIGSVGSVKLFQMTKIEEIRETFDINFFGQMELTQLISRLMIRKKNGSIINISSCAGLDGNTGMLQYVSSKAAMIGATKRLAIELGEFNIRVNSVAPGLTETDMGNMMAERLEQKTLSHIVFNRKAKPAEIANAVVFLGSDMSSYITGQILRVDGGMLI